MRSHARHCRKPRRFDIDADHRRRYRQSRFSTRLFFDDDNNSTKEPERPLAGRDATKRMGFPPDVARTCFRPFDPCLLMCMNSSLDGWVVPRSPLVSASKLLATRMTTLFLSDAVGLYQGPIHHSYSLIMTYPSYCLIFSGKGLILLLHPGLVTQKSIFCSLETGVSRRELVWTTSPQSSVPRGLGSVGGSAGAS